MKKILLFFIFTLVLDATCLAQNQTYSDTFTITTYYPAPHGVYGTMRLYPGGTPTEGLQEGVMYYDQSMHMMRYLNNTTWVNVTAGGGGYWAQGTGNNIYNTNIGNIGIGTMNPPSKLSVYDDINDFYTVRAYNSANGTNAGSIFASMGNTGTVNAILYSGILNSGYTSWAPLEASSAVFVAHSGVTKGINIGTLGPSDIKFWTNVQERMRINSTTGNVGIGTTSAAYLLTVNGIIGATSYYYSSDRSLKENIRPLSNSLDKITHLQGIAFQWKSDKRQDIGLAAQDVEKVYPELVATDRNSGLKSVEYGNMIAVLIEAIKEQQTQIQKLKAEINGFQK